MVAATAKAFHLSFDYVIHELSWQNMALYCSTLPTYDSKEDKQNEGATLNADKGLTAQQLSQLQAQFG